MAHPMLITIIEFVSQTVTFPKRILLIDHEPHLTAVVGSALQATGRYLIREEKHSRRALHSALHFQPDLILLDALHEHLEVDQIAHQIHADASLQDVPVVCLTSLSHNGQIGSVGFFGGYTFVANPFLLEDMVNCIAEMLNDKRKFGASR
jgi:PleD family two-component response regulator